jgi:hypothetical protein
MEHPLILAQTLFSRLDSDPAFTLDMFWSMLQGMSPTQELKRYLTKTQAKTLYILSPGDPLVCLSDPTTRGNVIMCVHGQIAKFAWLERTFYFISRVDAGKPRYYCFSHSNELFVMMRGPSSFNPTGRWFGRGDSAIRYACDLLKLEGFKPYRRPSVQFACASTQVAFPTMQRLVLPTPTKGKRLRIWLDNTPLLDVDATPAQKAVLVSTLRTLFPTQVGLDLET